MYWQSKPPMGVLVNFLHHVSRGLIGYWPMREGVGEGISDALGVTNMGMTQSPIWVGGSMGGALGGSSIKLNGTTQYLNSSGTASALDMGTNDLSVSAWIKTTQAKLQIFVSKMDFATAGDPSGWALAQNSGSQLQIFLNKNGTGSLTSSNNGTTLTNGKWHHIVMTLCRSGNGLRYVDGIRTGTALNISSFDGASLSNSERFLIGARDTASSQLPFNGSIDNVAVWNRVLSDSEVNELYTQPFCMLYYPNMFRWHVFRERSSTFVMSG